MPIPERLQPILAELKRGLQEIYGDRLRAVVLFGSQARGEATADSDVDVAVVLDDFESPFRESWQMGDILSGLSLDHDLVLTSMPITERDWIAGEKPIVRSIQADGVAV